MSLNHGPGGAGGRDLQFGSLFPEEPGGRSEDTLMPDIVKVMDTQQELLARSLGEGHGVIHGVAGSGKTLILGYRCLYLAKLLHKPILVLCYNITLAAKLLLTSHRETEFLVQLRDSRIGVR